MRARRTAIMAAALALSVSALGACSGTEVEDEAPTAGTANISDPRGLAESGQSGRESASEVAQIVAERLMVRDGTSLEQVTEALVAEGLLSEDADLKMDGAAGLEDVVEKTFVNGQTLDLSEPSKVGRYGELPDSKSVVERSVSLSVTGISTEELEDVSREDYEATVYVVLRKVDGQWVATGFQVLSFSEA